MTKTLTENKWFYTENGIKDASWHIVFKSEVLAPVPSYDEYKRLQEQLKEANKVIKYFAYSKTGVEQEDGRFIVGLAGFDGTKAQAIYYDPRPAQKYLEKWGVK